jgi:hypothetical protein
MRRTAVQEACVTAAMCCRHANVHVPGAACAAASSSHTACIRATAAPRTTGACQAPQACAVRGTHPEGGPCNARTRKRNTQRAHAVLADQRVIRHKHDANTAGVPTK